jgi:hypothetical protein
MKTRRGLKLKAVRKSHNPAKKWDAVFEYPDGHTKTTPFGARGMSDFTKHKDTKRRQRYLTRHGHMGEELEGPYHCRSSLSLDSLEQAERSRRALADYKRRFGF